MKRILNASIIASLGVALFGLTPLANAQTWTGGDIANNLDWSDALNWSGGAPTSSGTVLFPDGAFPLTTNVQGVVNNIVQSSTVISTLTYDNLNSDFDTTLIPAGVTLTVSGNMTVGISDASANHTVATMTGGGSLIAGNGSSTLSGQNGSGNGTASVLDLSGLTNFVFNSGGASSGAFNLGNGGSGSGIQVYLAAVSNNITAGTLNIGNNNTRGANTLNLGNGTNIINTDTINEGISKTTGTMQFNNSAGGGLTIANHTGTGRTAINLGGEGSSGSTTAVNSGSMLFNGGTVNILASTIVLANRGTRGDTPGATGILSFNSGVVDATTIDMATNNGGGGATATISVGGPGVLQVGTGSLSMVYANGANPTTGTLIVTNGGTVICSNNIYKSTFTGTATITVSDGSLVMASVAGSIGVVNGNPIDNLNLTNSTLTLPALGIGQPDVSVVNFNPDVAPNTINIGALPSITSYPTQLPVIGYTTPGSNLDSMVLGTLPGGFQGYISNNIANLSIDLVLTNGPASKADTWKGGVNNNWDTITFNWINNGVATNYLDLDQVTFDDSAQLFTVNLTGTRTPATVNGLTFNNYSHNYTLSGPGKITGPVQLVMNGTATNTLAETGGDNFSGGLEVNSGTIVLDDANNSISGGLTIAGGATVQIGNNDANGALPSGTLDDEGTLVFSHSNSLTIPVVIPGGGGLTQNGTGTLTLSAANTYNGNTTVTAGTLALTGAGAIAGSQQVTVTNATLDVSGVTTSAALIALNLTNATVAVKVGYLQINFNVSSLNLGGTSNAIVVKSLPPIAYYPATNTLLLSASPISGYNFVLGALPSTNYGGFIVESPDTLSVLLVLTNGPIGIRPSVTWSGVDALNVGNTNWSDAQNWQTPGVPASTESVTFNDSDAVGGTPFDVQGDGMNGIVNPGTINNAVDFNATNTALSYANTGGDFQNTLIDAGKTLTLNGSLTVSGAGGNVTILGAGSALKMNNPGNAATLSVENGTTPTLDMSGLDTFTAAVSQIGIGYDIASSGTAVNGTLYLAKTNMITTGGGFAGTGAALVVGGTSSPGSSSMPTHTATLYLGQTNSLYVDGIVLGVGPIINASIAFNPALITNNPVAYIRGIAGDSSRVTRWALGDNTVNLNNDDEGSGDINDFTAGRLNALVNTMVIGQGAQGNEDFLTLYPGGFVGTFNMGAGKLDVTTLNLGVSGTSAASAGIGIMNVTGGTVIANSLGLGVVGGSGGLITTSGMLNLTNATLVASNGVTIGVGTAGGTLSIISSTMKVLNSGTIGSTATPLTTLNIDGATLQLNVNGTAGVANIVATTVNVNNPTTINIGSAANVSGTMQIPLISYTGADPFSALTLGTYPAGYNNVSLVDDTANSSVDLSITSSVNATPTNLVATVSGNVLALSWPADHTGWRLLVQINHLASGLSANTNDWMTIPGSTSVNQTNITIDPTKPAEFYRLAYP